jgi:hypothetical protein
MVVRHVSYKFAVLAMLCGAVIFFMIFPTAQGPYSVVNGPVTTLVSIRTRLLLWLGMASVVLRLLSRHHFSQSLAVENSARHEALLPQPLPPEITALRC